MEKIENRTASLLRVLLSVMLFAAAFSAFPQQAFAEGGVTLVKVWAGSRGVHDVWPGPVDSYNLSLEFDKNVSYPNQGDDAFVRENLEKVYVMDSAGRRVDSIVTEGASGPEDKTVIYLRATDWLAPLSEYTVVARAGIRAKSGVDATAVEYRTMFTTGAECSVGLNVYQISALVVCGLALVIGLIVSSVRKKRAR